MTHKVLAALVPLLLLAAGTPAAPPPTPALASWLQVQTPHFTVVTDSSERQVRHVAGQLERMHDVFAKLLPHATDDSAGKIVVVALRDRRGFQALEPAAYLSRGSLDLAGLFLHGQDRSYILLRLDSSGEHPYATVYHEYTHSMLRRADYLPLWLNEGLAQFYQNTDIFEHEVRLGQPDANDLLFLRQRRLMGLQTLFTVDHSSPYYHEEDKGNIFYAESWALTHFLFLQDFGRASRLHRYAECLMKGEPALLAAQHAFGDLNQLQRQFEAYIAHGDYKALTMPLQNAVDERQLAVEPLPTADADALRADVLAHDGRMREAEALASAVLVQAPRSAAAHESMGLIKLRAGDMDAARKWYGEAVDLHSPNFLAYFYFGTIALGDGAQEEKAAASLRQSVAMNPHFAPAVEALAQYDAAHGHLDEALSLSLQAVQLEPENIDYRLEASRVRLLRKEVPSAVAALEETAKIARTPDDKARVQARLEQARHYNEQADSAVRTQAFSQSTDLATTHIEGAVPEAVDAKGSTLHPVALKDPEHAYPGGPPSGPKHTAEGVLHHVGCFYPKGMTLQLDGNGPAVLLYSNDLYAVSYRAGSSSPKKDLDPCRDFEGLKAKVTYAEVEDPGVQGQIVAVELNE